jgi:hypothetical protein
MDLFKASVRMRADVISLTATAYVAEVGIQVTTADEVSE